MRIKIELPIEDYIALLQYKRDYIYLNMDSKDDVLIAEIDEEIALLKLRIQ